MTIKPTGQTRIPLAPGAWPIIGHSLRLLRDQLAFLGSLPAHGDLVRIKAGPLKAVVVCTPELTRQVLRDDRTFDKTDRLWEHMRDALGNNLGTCPRASHRRQRRLVQPAFHPSRLPSYADVMVTQAADLAAAWHDGQVLDVPAEMGKLITKITLATLFSESLSATKLDQMHGDVRGLLDTVTSHLLMWPPLDRLPLPINRTYRATRFRLRQAAMQIITERRSSTHDHGDLLSALMTATDPETGDALTDTEITDTIMAFLIAGIEVAAAILSWALHELGRHPDIQARLNTEVDTVLADHPATHRDLPHLDLTGRIIVETIRLHTPSWLLTRATTTDTRLGPYTLPKGTTIIYSPYLIQHLEDHDPTHQTFDPDRWISQPPRDAGIAFGGGARKCIGDTFGIIETTLALASITKHWNLHHLPHQTVRPTATLVSRPDQLHMHAHTRTQDRRST
ncbi:pentalenene oxygenase [Lentzea atacamensis]|uniref:Pentalenene oxygenase n=1 Tax=Lentzea atacamensis TaxID=531938 RepID=A0A316HCH4_9PSEU|nr:cytochrome P450 [Lentzea atacamensis]PWK77973.1 pentalenene oxygenase [Lentzea atacamensis]